MKKLSSWIKVHFCLKHIYYTIMSFFIIISVINCIKTNGSAIYDMLVPNYSNHYWDLFTSIYHNFLQTPYEEGVVYPPGANIICLILSKFFSAEMYNNGANAMRDSQIGIVIMLWFMIFSTGILVFLIIKHSKAAKRENFFLIFTFLCSAPYIRELNKMNIVIISVILVYLFLLYKDDHRFYVRFAAIVCLAAAVSIKIYPVFFGLFFIKNKRWKETFISIAVGIVFFFGPFFLFGGPQNIILMLKNIFNTTDIFNTSGLGFKIDITNTINIFGDLMGYNGDIRFIGTVFNYVLLFLGFGAFFVIKSEWKSIAILSLLALTYPTFSNSYGILIMIPALITFFNTENKLNADNVIYVILFAIMFAPMCFGGQDIFPTLTGVTRVNLFTFLESISIALMLIFLILDGLKTVITQSRKHIKVKRLSQ